MNFLRRLTQTGVKGLTVFLFITIMYLLTVDSVCVDVTKLPEAMLEDKIVTETPAIEPLMLSKSA